MAEHPRADFWKFFAGQTISNLGSSFTYFALPLLVYKLTGSALNLGLASAMWFVPYLLFGLVIGAWVDRIDRKRLMIATDVARGLLIGVIPLLAALDHLTVWWIYAVMFLTATLSIAFDAAEFAAIPSLVDRNELVKANGRIQASYSGATVLGPLLGGSLLTVMPVEDILVIDAASFGLSALALVSIARRFNVEEERERTTIRRDVVEGLRFVLGHPVLRNISLMMALVNLVGTTAWAQLVLFAKEQLDASDAEVGYLFSAGSAGIVVFGLLAGRIRRRLAFSVAALGALMLDGLLTLGFALNTWYPAALLLWGTATGIGIFFNINTQSLRQAITPPHLLGRVVTIAGVLAWSANPVGALLGGWAIEETGSVVGVYATVGALMFSIAFLFWLFSPLGRAEDYLPAPEPEPAAP